MIVVFRDFRSRAGDQERVLDALRRQAAAMIRDRRAEAVMVCQRADIPQRLLWIEHPPGGGTPPLNRKECFSLPVSDLMESEGTAVRAAFLDGAYQSPLPVCRVWVAETSHDETARELLTMSRRATSDRRVCGASIYRTLEDSSRMIAFFALVPDVSPDDYFESRGKAAHGPHVRFYPLRASWTIGRLTPGTPSVASIVQYPRTFAARMGLVLPSKAAAASPEPVATISVGQGS
jgi:hypothetical protein